MIKNYNYPSVGRNKFEIVFESNWFKEKML